MIFWPNCSVKTLAKCESGAIIRPLEGPETGSFAIACDVKDDHRRALVSFKGDGPEFQIISNPDALEVLEYTAENLLQVDQAGAFEASLRQVSGCLLRDSGGWRMNVRCPEGFSHKNAQYNFLTKTLEFMNGDSSIGIFGKWRLVFVNSDRPHDVPFEITSFDWEEQKKGK